MIDLGPQSMGLFLNDDELHVPHIEHTKKLH